MGILEDGFHRLHWPPLVREVVITTHHPGYRYEFFRSFKELDEYFSNELGSDWRTQPWAQYWMNQHLETKNIDRRTSDNQMKKPGGPRKDGEIIRSICRDVLHTTPGISTRKLCAYLFSLGYEITTMTALRIIKEFKDPNARIHSITYIVPPGITTPNNQHIPEGYTKQQWRADWRRRYNLD